MAIGALEKESLPCDIPKTFGVFIPEITVDEFRNAPLESIEDLLAMGEFHDIDLSGYQEPKRGKWEDMVTELSASFGRHLFVCSECNYTANYFVGGSEEWWDKREPNYCPNCGCPNCGAK